MGPWEILAGRRRWEWQGCLGGGGRGDEPWLAGEDDVEPVFERLVLVGNRLPSPSAHDHCVLFACRPPEVKGHHTAAPIQITAGLGSLSTGTAAIYISSKTSRDAPDLTAVAGLCRDSTHRGQVGTAGNKASVSTIPDKLASGLRIQLTARTAMAGGSGSRYLCCCRRQP